jgi:hypothetical protein
MRSGVRGGGTIAILWAGCQPLLAHWAEAQRVFQLAERLGTVNAAAAELDTTWPSLRRRSSTTVWHVRPQP